MKEFVSWGLTLVLLNKDATPISNFQPIRLFDPDCCYKFAYLLANSADPNQLASSEANWSGSTLFAKAGYIGFSRTRVNSVPCQQYFSHNKLSLRERYKKRKTGETRGNNSKHFTPGTITAGLWSVLRGLDFLPFLPETINFVTSWLLYFMQFSDKGSLLKGKNLLPLGANSFLFRADPFSEGTKTILTELSTGKCKICLS